MALYISNEEARHLLTMPECIEALSAVFAQQAAGEAENMLRQRIPLRNGRLAVMAGTAFGTGYAGVRYFQPRGHNQVVLFDAETGQLEAVIEAEYASMLRTGAASGLATRHMARTDADTLAVIGTGKHAAAQIEAIAAVRALKQVRVFSRTKETRDAFAAGVARHLSLDVVAASTAEAAVRDASIVTTISNSSKPVTDGAWLEPGVHVNAAGTIGEIDAKTVRRSGWTVVDNIDQALADSAALLRSRAGDPYDATLAAVVAGTAAGRPSEQAITLFLSRGLGLEDVAACSVIFKKARAAGIGVPLPY